MFRSRESKPEPFGQKKTEVCEKRETKQTLG